MSQKNVTFVFFGTGPLAESVLASLYRAGYIPSLVVTKPDRRMGRHMHLTPPHIKTWSEMKGIPVLQPEKLDKAFCYELQAKSYELFIVASYGKIIPETILNIPTHGTLNVHPSLLPLYRGPSPIEQTLLDGNMTTGITIMKLDNEMDHGPILAQNAFIIPPEITVAPLEVMCGQAGGELLVHVIDPYLDGTLIPKDQDHSKATLCKKITKEHGEITLDTDIETVRRKFRALTPWPSVYFFFNHNNQMIRVKVASVDLTTPYPDSSKAADVLLFVIPEGKKEMSWESFKRGYMGSH